MAAGLGFKTFTTGEVLTAADVNGYLMQGILVFATEAARNSAITAPQEGQFAFTKDTNSLWYYTGSAWVASGATGDIEGVTAGVGISGGGTSGTVTITNSMATAIDAKGDLIVGTGADTFSRLAVGTNGQVLTADSAEATGLKFATPAVSTPSFVGWSLTKSAGQSVANVTNVAITFDVETFDDGSFHTSSDAKITIPSGKGGKYLIVATVVFSTNTSNSRLIALYKNGSVLKYMVTAPGVSGGYVRIVASAIVDAVATDYFELYAYQDSGSTLTIVETTTDTTYSGTYLGA